MCSSSCLTQDHATFGECLRAKNLRIGYCRDAVGKGDFTSQKNWDKELDLYADARRQGIQPSGTKLPEIRTALDWSEKAGYAYDASKSIQAVDL